MSKIRLAAPPMALLLLLLLTGSVGAYEECPGGCSCMAEEAARTLGMDWCPGEKVACEYQETRDDKIAMYCFSLPEEGAVCHYDNDQGVCSGNELCTLTPSSPSPARRRH